MRPTRQQREEAEAALCLDMEMLRDGAEGLFRKALEEHAAACDLSEPMLRADALARVDDIIASAKRLLEMAAEKAQS